MGVFYPETGNAGYAFWIASNNGTFKKYGKLNDCENSNEAEMMAIANALHFVRTHPSLENCTKIIINTDSELAINCINPKYNYFGSKKRERHKRFRSIRGVMTKYLGKYKGKKCEFEFRHVKAHKKIESAREYVNNWLDKHAKLGANS